MTSQGRTARAIRAGAATAAAVLVALGAHLVGGGPAPAPLLVAAVLALAWPAGLVLLGGRPSLWRQGAVVGTAQALLHGLFALGSPGQGVAVGHDAMAGMHGALPLAGVASAPHPPTMWWMHAAAWVATVAAWRWGGAVLRRLLAGLAVPRILTPREPAPADAAVRIPAAPRPTLREALLAAHRDRGPPLPA